MLNKKQYYRLKKLIICMPLLLTIPFSHAAQQSTAARETKNTFILNNGTSKTVTIAEKKNTHGKKSYTSIVNEPGVKVIEKVQQQPGNPSVQENKIVVNITQNKSIEVLQKFDSSGRKLSRTTVKKSAGNDAKIVPSKKVIKSQNGKVDTVIEQQTTKEGRNEVTTTTVRSNHFPLLPLDHCWTLSAAGGYEHFSSAMSGDGGTAIARLSLNRRYAVIFNQFVLGVEAGIQNGTSMKLKVNPVVQDALGGTAINAIIRPTVELLQTFSKNITEDAQFAAFTKIGVAYRQMTFDRDTLSNIHKYGVDLHLGLSSAVTDNVNILLFYHVIFGNNPNVRANLGELPTNNLGYATNIPTEQGILLGASFSF